MLDFLQPVWEFRRDQAVAPILSLLALLIAAGEFFRRRNRSQQEEPGLTIRNESTGDHVRIDTKDADVTTIEDVQIDQGNIYIGKVETRRPHRPWWRRLFR